MPWRCACEALTGAYRMVPPEESPRAASLLHVIHLSSAAVAIVDTEKVPELLPSSRFKIATGDRAQKSSSALPAL